MFDRDLWNRNEKILRGEVWPAYATDLRLRELYAREQIEDDIRKEIVDSDYTCKALQAQIDELAQKHHKHCFNPRCKNLAIRRILSDELLSRRRQILPSPTKTYARIKNRQRVIRDGLRKAERIPEADEADLRMVGSEISFLSRKGKRFEVTTSQSGHCGWEDFTVEKNQ